MILRLYFFRLDLVSELGAKAANQLGRKLRYIHTLRDHELATQNRARAVFVLQLAIHTAILAVLIPAEPAVGDSVRADKLETAQDGIFFRDEERPAEDINFYQALERTKDLGHGCPFPKNV